MNTPATITTPPVLPERTSPDQLRAVEDAAFDALTAWTTLTEDQAHAIWEACQRFQTRDPLITRLLRSHPSQCDKILPRLETVIARLADPDAQLLTVAGVLTWSLHGDRDRALLLLGLAIEYRPADSTSDLAELMAAAIEIGAAPDVWLAVTADLSLTTQRGGTP